MHFLSILAVASSAMTFVSGLPSPVEVTKRDAASFCTTLGFTNPYCCVPQVDAGNVIDAGSNCVPVPNPASITTITQYDAACEALQLIPLCCAVVALNGIGVCSAAVQH